MAADCAPGKVVRLKVKHIDSAQKIIRIEQPTQHVPEHAVAANAQRAADHLQVGVTIADVPGKPHVRRCRVDLEERLGLAGDAYQGAILEHETVAVVQASRKTAYGHRRSKHKCWKLAR
jgi:hypothetical protein